MMTSRLRAGLVCTLYGATLGLAPLLTIPVHAAAQTPVTVNDVLGSGRAHMVNGQFAEAAQLFEQAAQRSMEARDIEGRFRATQALAEARLALGAVDQAITMLDDARAWIEPSGNKAWKTLLHAQLGGARLRTGDMAGAQPLLLEALASARALNNRVLTAAVLNDLGTLQRLARDGVAARNAYDEAHRLAEESNDKSLLLRILLNTAVMELEQHEPGRARELAETAHQAAIRLDSQPHFQASILIRSGLILQHAARLDPAGQNQTMQAAHGALRDALRTADALKEPRLVSAASGALGSVYLQAGRHEEALTLTHRAISTAQRATASDLLFRWHWQTARIHRARSNPDMAIASYRRAVTVHESGNLSVPSADAGEIIAEPDHTVYLELADLLLRKSGTLDHRDQTQRLLAEARDAVEKLKARELQDYFRDSCVAEARTRVRALVHNLGPRTAVLYPIALPDRLELLLNLGPEIKHVTVAVPERTVIKTAKAFREAVESQRTRAYLQSAQQIYRWLIQPITRELADAGIRTLVTIPDHALRAIPMAALHDGERFLAERFAVVMAPGMELTDPRPLPLTSANALLLGLTEAVQGYPALTHVGIELDNVRKQVNGRTLMNKAFVREALEQELTRERYHIAHIASHGEFTGNVRESFVLTYDGKLNVGELARYIGFNRFRDDPLDLLTLSACQTAAGDERALLGLAGITVKAGARSALASLWPIHDEATSVLMSEFYRQLREPGVGKARALQIAQQKLMTITRYRHPGYWSGFVLIGNWL